MKVLLFSCSTGGGHNSAAAALAQELEARNVENRTYDALQFLPKSTADLISHGHDFAYRYAPKIYGAGYRREEKHPSSLFYEQSIRGIGPLYEELIDQAPDAVICVHLFPAMMMTELHCSYGVRIPTYFVATDFTCSPGVGDLQVDGLCIPHRDLIPEFVTAGLPQERLFPTGIPVGQQFLHPESREEARRALDLPVDGRILTLACGSMGAGPLRTTAQKVAELMGPEDLLVTICGSNHRMYQQMQSDFFRPVDRVRVLGYTHEMFRYMYASDLLLTKAGGLTTAEAVAAGTPLLYLNAVPGCESHNIDFMTRHGCALAVSSDEELQPMLQGILSGAIDPGAWWPVGRTSLPHPLPPSAIWPCATQVRKITTERNPAGTACGVLFGFRSEGPHPWNRRGVYLACFFRIPASISPTIW